MAVSELAACYDAGTGKELVARQLHALSRRRNGPVIAVNCAAVVETLLEAELFGIEERTATGVRGRRGKFEHASGDRSISIGGTITVGHSKTDAGTGRKVPINDRALAALTAWAQNFPKGKDAHYVFPSEQYGLATNDRVVKVYETEPTEATTSVQEGWQLAKERCGVKVRLHDLRHTAATRMLEAGVGLTVVGEILGWARSTTVLMATRYGHIGHVSLRRPIDLKRSLAIPCYDRKNPN